MQDKLLFPRLSRSHISRTMRFVAMLMAALSVQAAHSDPTPQVDVPVVQALPADVSSIDGLMRAFYEVVNVPPTAPRQWARDRTLYSPWIRFIGISESPTGSPDVVVWTHQQLVNASEALVRSGFSEREIHRTTRVYGRVAHVDSTYETEVAGPSGPRRSRGVNSIEMYFDGKRWWISSVMWMTENPRLPIPAGLLPP